MNLKIVGGGGEGKNAYTTRESSKTTWTADECDKIGMYFSPKHEIIVKMNRPTV
jgi:hypothetical protein